jgi:hypothetical protein
MKPSSYVADFDSATAMLRALAHYLNGRDFPLLGAMPQSRTPIMKVAAQAVNRLPRRLREQVYIWSGRFEAIPPRQLLAIDLNRVAEDLLRLYPVRQYPAVAIGSSNGAAIHLWAALGIPWLPQTLLIPVARSGCHPDEPVEDVRWAQGPARALLDANPDVQLHHMHDPVQDRLMIQRMTYFRVKRRRLGPAYEMFLRQSLKPGGTILLIECNLNWLTTQYGDRHFFQFGALGGATQDEYQNGGPRVEAYLARYRSHRRRWQAPQPNGESPEAEWGFEPALRRDLESFAQRHGFRLRRIVFDQPEQMSHLVADFYSSWNRQRGIDERRLLVESFILMEPFWTVRTGCVPFWMVFNKQPSAQALKEYLQNGHSFDAIDLMLFSHGVDSIGLVSIDEWRRILMLGSHRISFLGVDEGAYPRDFAVFVRYHEELVDKIQARYPMPPALSLEALDDFLGQTKTDYHVEWH